jgi:hypothetical protein
MAPVTSDVRRRDRGDAGPANALETFLLPFSDLLTGSPAHPIIFLAGPLAAARRQQPTFLWRPPILHYPRPPQEVVNHFSYCFNHDSSTVEQL